MKTQSTKRRKATKESKKKVVGKEKGGRGFVKIKSK